MRGPRFSPPRLLTADLCAKVTDFGLAKFLAGGDLTHSGDVLGTPSYMAPEQAAGKSAPITAAVDVYGLGAILYEALTGRPPFAAATVDATLGLVRQDEPVPPRRLQPTVPRDLETICLKCLRKEPGRRYATARDLADDLRPFRGRGAGPGPPVGATERVIVWCRRKPGFAGLLAALVLVFLAGSAGVLWQWQRARGKPATERGAFRRERDMARQEKARAEHHLRMVRDQVDRLNRLGDDSYSGPGVPDRRSPCWRKPSLSTRNCFPRRATTRRPPRGRNAFRSVAEIHHTLDQPAMAAEAWGRQANLLTGLLEEEPASKDLRMELSDSHRWRGNALRDAGKAREAREAYDQAARLQEGLLHEFPDKARYQLALANTLLNMAGLLSPGPRPTSENGFTAALSSSIAPRSARRRPPDGQCRIGPCARRPGDVLPGVGRGPEAEAAVREALEVHQRVLAGGQLKGNVERYVARNFVNLGRILATAGQATEAEQCFRKP